MTKLLPAGFKLSVAGFNLPVNRSLLSVARWVLPIGKWLCTLALAHSTFSYHGRPATAAEEQLRNELLALSAKHPRYGYRRMAALLRRQGWRVGQRHIQRLRQAKGLGVPPTRRKIIRRGVSTGLPTMAPHRNQVWTWDFIADATVRGGTSAERQRLGVRREDRAAVAERE